MPRISAVTRKEKPLSPAKLLEKHVTEQVLDFLRHRGWRPIRMQRTVLPGHFQSGEPGQPDYLCLRYLPDVKPATACLAIWIEFKSPTGKLRDGQPEWHARERLRGGTVWVVDDYDWFQELYMQSFGFLHRGDTGVGQLDLLAELREKP